jgi:hypothetical protein
MCTTSWMGCTLFSGSGSSGSLGTAMPWRQTPGRSGTPLRRMSAQVQVVALRRQAAVDGAGADGDQDLAVGLRNSRSTCTFSALHRPPSMRPMSQGPQCLMSVIGERSNSTSLQQLEDALVDVEQRHVAAEAAGEAGGGHAQLFRHRLGGIHRGVHADSLTWALIGALSYWRWPIGTANPLRLGRITPTGQMCAARSSACSALAPRRPSGALTSSCVCAP